MCKDVHAVNIALMNRDRLPEFTNVRKSARMFFLGL